MKPIDALIAFRAALVAERRSLVSEALAANDATAVIDGITSLQNALQAVDRALMHEREMHAGIVALQTQTTRHASVAS